MVRLDHCELLALAQEAHEFMALVHSYRSCIALLFHCGAIISESAYGMECFSVDNKQCGASFHDCAAGVC